MSISCSEVAQAHPQSMLLEEKRTKKQVEYRRLDLEKCSSTSVPFALLKYFLEALYCVLSLHRCPGILTANKMKLYCKYLFTDSSNQKGLHN